MKSTSSQIKKKKGRTFEQMLRTKKFTSRELTGHLRMATATIEKSIADPSRLSLGAVFRLADLINDPVELVLSELLDEIEANIATEAAKRAANNATGQAPAENSGESEAAEEEEEGAE